MERIKLSIIVPVYNVEKFVKKCIASLLVEDCENYEIIVVNDGTKDRSIEVVRENFNDPRIRIIEQENGGLSAARNYGITDARGEYIWCVDSDDWVETAEIPKMISLLDGELDALYFGSYYLDYDDGRKPKTCMLKNKANSALELYCTEFAHCAPYYLMRRAMLDDNNLRFTEGILHEDSLFTPIMITHCNKVRRYERPVYHHLQREGSITQVVKPKRIYDLIYVITHLMEFGNSLDDKVKYQWGGCVAQITNGLLLCTNQCEDTEAKRATKGFVNHNKDIIDYLSHSGRNNRILAHLATLMGGRLYQAYAIFSKIRY